MIFKNLEKGQLDIEKLKMGDRVAFHTLHSAYFRRLIFYANTIIKSVPSSEDIAAEAFVKLFLNRTKIGSEEYAVNFLYKVVRNDSINFLRENSKYNDLKTELSIVGDSEENSALELERRLTLTDRDMIAILYAEISKLPNGARKVLSKLYFEGKSITQVAKELGITKRTVSNQRQIAISKLQNKLPNIDILCFIPIMVEVIKEIRTLD